MPTIGTRGNAAARGYGFSGVSGPSFTITWTPAPAGSPFTTGSYTGVDFTASATVTVSGGNKDIEYVVVAGGGGGGAVPAVGGGGGAGGMKTGTLTAVSPGPYTVTVGGGGTGGVPPGNPTFAYATNGSGSVFGPVSTTGGGYGADFPNPGGNPGQPGGSGGGGGIRGVPLPQGLLVPLSGGTGISGEGNDGATGLNNGLPQLSGGGGGGKSQAGNTNGTGRGGDGQSTSIKGTPITLAGGGGGASNDSTYATGDGGSGGGGNGTTNTRPAATAGTANTGGGGGGTRPPISITAQNGGSGRVIIRWLT